MARSTINLDFNLSALIGAIKGADDDVEIGAMNGMRRVLDLWRVKAINLAPIGRYPKRRGGNLRARIKPTQVTRTNTGIEGGLVANAFNDGFNYGYFLHEIAPNLGIKAREPGTSLTFMEDAVDEERFGKLIEESVKSELKRKGWSDGVN